MKTHLLLWVGLAAVVASGCGDRRRVPYLGKWTGSFEPESVSLKTGVRDPRRHRLVGYLQVYATGNKYKMRLEGEQEAVEVSGTWEMKPNRLLFTPLTVTVDDQGGEDEKDPNRAWIVAEQLRVGYSAPLAYRISPDKKRLDGLTVAIGPLTGHHVFAKESSGR